MEQPQKVLIKGMVCHRCISTVQQELQNAGLQAEEIRLGEVTLPASAGEPAIRLIEQKLAPLGFSLLEDRRKKLVREVKRLVREVYSGDYDFPHAFRFSELAARITGRDYDTISSTFSAEEGITIEKYIIGYRIEKVREFLVYTDQTLADISFRLGFSSVAHLSRQFKLQTGLNPSQVKAMRQGGDAPHHAA